VWTLDHDLAGVMQHAGEDEWFPPSGYDFLCRVQNQFDPAKWPKDMVFVHSANPWGRARMQALVAEINGKLC
jgi:hypothetical protein